MPSPRPPVRLLLAPGALGILAGLVGSFLQAASWSGVRWGLLLALLMTGLVFLASGWAVASRHGALSAGAAWVLTVYLLASWAHPEGDVVLPASWDSLLWFFAGFALALGALCVPYDQVARWTAREPDAEGGKPSAHRVHTQP